MGMLAARAPAVQAALCAAACGAAVTYGATWLGLDWVYNVGVNGNRFEVGAGFFLGALTGILAGAAAALAALHGARRLGTGALGVGVGLILAAFLWTFLVWAPAGAAPGQLDLLRDVAGLGFALLALGVPLALPGEAPMLARAGGLAVAAPLVPLVLFPGHAAAAGLAEVEGTLMLLFFAQAGVVLAGVTGGRVFHLPRRSAPEGEPEVAWLRARAPGRAAKGPERKPRLQHEPLRAGPQEGPTGPGGPRGPRPSEAAARKTRWFYQF